MRTVSVSLRMDNEQRLPDYAANLFAGGRWNMVSAQIEGGKLRLNYQADIIHITEGTLLVRQFQFNFIRNQNWPLYVSAFFRMSNKYLRAE